MNVISINVRFIPFTVGFTVLILVCVFYSVFPLLNTALSSPTTMKLDIEGSVSISYSESDIKQSLPVASGWGGKIKTTGSITHPTYWKGIHLSVLLDSLLGDLEYNLTFLSQDGFYNESLSNDDVNGAIQAFDSENVTLAIKAIPLLAYEENNQTLDADDGPLRLVFVGENNLSIFTDSTLWVKQVDTIQITVEDGSTVILSTTTQSSVETSSSNTTSKSSFGNTIIVFVPTLILLILFYRKKRNH